jgi:hypothetical protein
VVALFGDGIAAEAAMFADSVSPAYEWEGYSDGPLSEMAGAERYVAGHPTTRIRPYAQLLIAHRGICALEALQYERKNGIGHRDRNSAQQSRVRSRSQQAMLDASKATHPLVRFVARVLSRNPRCF